MSGRVPVVLDLERPTRALGVSSPSYLGLRRSLLFKRFISGAPTALRNQPLLDPLRREGETGPSSRSSVMDNSEGPVLARFLRHFLMEPIRPSEMTEALLLGDAGDAGSVAGEASTGGGEGDRGGV